MAEFGVSLIFLAFVAMAGLFFFFGIEDKEPTCIVLGCAILGGIFMMLSMKNGVIL